MADKAPPGSWSSGLCDCFTDCGTCCLTMWCPCVSFGRIAEIVDKGENSCCAMGTLYTIVGGFTHFASICAWVYRARMRKQYGIEGNDCGDCCVSWFCPHLTLCQQYRELKARGFDVAAGWEGNVARHAPAATSAPAVEGGMKR